MMVFEDNSMYDSVIFLILGERVCSICAVRCAWFLFLRLDFIRMRQAIILPPISLLRSILMSCDFPSKFACVNVIRCHRMIGKQSAHAHAHANTPNRKHITFVLHRDAVAPPLMTTHSRRESKSVSRRNVSADGWMNCSAPIAL